MPSPTINSAQARWDREGRYTPAPTRRALSFFETPRERPPRTGVEEDQRTAGDTEAEPTEQTGNYKAAEGGEQEAGDEDRLGALDNDKTEVGKEGEEETCFQRQTIGVSLGENNAKRIKEAARIEHDCKAIDAFFRSHRLMDDAGVGDVVTAQLEPLATAVRRLREMHDPA